MARVSVFGTNEGSEVGTKETGAGVDGAGVEGASDVRRGVGTKGAGLAGAGTSDSGASSTRRLSSIRSVSTKPLKFCFVLSFCKLMTVISRSGIVSGSCPGISGSP